MYQFSLMSEPRTCGLCDAEISNFHQLLNQFNIDKNRSINICKQCFDKIVEWQKLVFSTLFPTKRTRKG